MGVQCRHRDGYAFDTRKSRCGSRGPGEQYQQAPKVATPGQAFFGAELSLALLDLRIHKHTTFLHIDDILI
jgi:hypothetical protein